MALKYSESPQVCTITIKLFFLFTFVWTFFLFPDLFSANLSTKDYAEELVEHPSGVYFGWAGLATRGVFKMVMSIGWNPDYNNTEKTIVSLYETFFKLVHSCRAFFFFNFSLCLRRSHGCFMISLKISMEKSCVL